MNITKHSILLITPLAIALMIVFGAITVAFTVDDAYALKFKNKLPWKFKPSLPPNQPINTGTFTVTETGCKVIGGTIMQGLCILGDRIYTIKSSEICIQVITTATDPLTGRIYQLPTPCDVPSNFIR